MKQQIFHDKTKADFPKMLPTCFRRLTDTLDLKCLYDKFQKEIELNTPSPGPVNKRFIAKHGRDLARQYARGAPSPKAVQKLANDILNGPKQSSTVLLKEYSPFLGSFCQSAFFEEVSVFGQFDGDAEPTNVVKISGFQQVRNGTLKSPFLNWDIYFHNRCYQIFLI